MLLAGYATKAAQAMGDAYLLPAIAAVVLGGTSILGGRGSYLGTVAGVILITLLQSILSVMQMPEVGPPGHLRRRHHRACCCSTGESDWCGDIGRRQMMSGCGRPMTDGAAHRGCGRRSKTSKGGNRGKGYVRRCGALYGDLAAARGAADESRWGRAEPVDWD